MPIYVDFDPVPIVFESRVYILAHQNNTHKKTIKKIHAQLFYKRVQDNGFKALIGNYTRIVDPWDVIDKSCSNFNMF